MSRELSRPKLEQRLGPFQPAPAQEGTKKAIRQYEKRPLGLYPSAAKLHARYQAAQAQAKEIRTREWERVRARKERRIETAMRTVRLKRAALKLAKMPLNAKKLMYAALASALREEISEIKRESMQERLSISQKCRRRQWLDWLRHHAGAGNKEALTVLRRRKTTRDVAGDGINGTMPLLPSASGRRNDSVTKQGTIIYRVGASAVRDEGDALRVSRGANKEAMQVALQMALERFGQRITVEGSDAFREQIVIAAAGAHLPVVFDDLALEQRRLKLAAPPSARDPIISAGTHAPPARASERPAPAAARDIRPPPPGVLQNRDSAARARSRR